MDATTRQLIEEIGRLSVEVKQLQAEAKYKRHCEHSEFLYLFGYITHDEMLEEFARAKTVKASRTKRKEEVQ